MAWNDFMTNHPMIIALVFVGGFGIWKFIIQPIMNEGKSMEPTEKDIKGFEFDPTEDLQM